jgi:hypothetical protein
LRDGKLSRRIFKREKKTERKEFPTSQKEHTAFPLIHEVLGRADCLFSFDMTWPKKKKINLRGYTEKKQSDLISLLITDSLTELSPS